MIRRIVIVVLFFGALFILSFNIAYAGEAEGSAEVLPKGVSRVKLTTQIYLPVDEQFNDSGDSEDIAKDYNTNLDSSVFPELGLVEAGFGMPAGSASLGDSVVDLEYQWYEVDFYYFYGLTDRLTVGVHIPYWWNKTKVNANLDTSSATVGKNPFVPGGVAPLSVPGTESFTTDDLQNLLVQQYGYERFEDWSDSGFSDIEAGFRYQYLNTDNWRLAFLGALRFPTGETDDPDNLADTEFGEGVYAFLFHFNNDYVGFKNWVLDATFRYELKLPDEETKRVPNSVDMPITSNKESVDRDVGDVIELEVSAKYQLVDVLSATVLYRYGYKFEDSISGDQGFNYQSLEDESDYREHIGIVSLSYSTIPLYREKKFPVPLNATIKYRTRFAGKNRAKSQWIGLGLDIFF